MLESVVRGYFKKACLKTLIQLRFWINLELFIKGYEKKEKSISCQACVTQMQLKLKPQQLLRIPFFTFLHFSVPSDLLISISITNHGMFSLYTNCLFRRLHMCTLPSNATKSSLALDSVKYMLAFPAGRDGDSSLLDLHFFGY